MTDVSAITVKELIDTRLGRPVVMEACQVKTQAITNWIRDEQIPARHYLTFQRLCREHGVPAPAHLFFGETAPRPASPKARVCA